MSYGKLYVFLTRHACNIIEHCPTGPHPLARAESATTTFADSCDAIAEADVSYE